MTERISKYEIVEKIGEGGFGVVYKARDPYIKRLVAIKTCRPENEEARKRFFREAEIAGSFDHPNVTIVHDFGVEDDMAFLVQEYLSGEDLVEKINRREEIPLKTKIEYLLQTARGLAYAHSQGVIHRDIKPGNIRILENGQAKIMDFGIAKLTSSATRLTQKGMAVGTVGYLSPEQVGGGEIGTSTDVFAFGVVTYELVAYESPFQGGDLSTVMRQILRGAHDPLDERVPECPPALARLVDTCLDKDAIVRPTCVELADSLQEILEDLASEEGETVSRTILLPVADLRGDQSEPEASTPPAPKAGKGEGSDQYATREGPEMKPPEEDETPDVPDSEPSGDPDRPGTKPIDPSIAETVVDTELPPLPSPTEGEVPTEEPEGRAKAAAEALPPPPTEAPVPEEQEEESRAEVPPSPATKKEVEKPAREAPAPATTGETSGKRASWIPVAAVGSAIVVAVVAAILFLGDGEEEPAEPVATPTPERPPVEAAASPPATADEAPLVVTASPWGQIVQVLDQEGREVRAASGGSTPARMIVPPGLYSVIVAPPGGGEPEICQVVVGDDGGSCHLAFAEVDVTEYFRAAGWWE